MVMAALQRVRDIVACRGGRGRRDKARRHNKGSRGRRWPRRYGGAAAAALGLERERERKRGRVRERVRERSGLRGVVRGVAREAGEEAGGGQGKQEVAEAASAPVGHAHCLLARGRRQGRSGDGLGRAGPGKWAPGNFLLSLSLLFLFYFCYFVFDLI